ncbi:MAG: ankyrin repeat protein [Gammaproteobacteria bacterium]|jgi:ankyrin repeat protein|nr:ankyrin repeat protein [Gammaproteobacteria bacterium]
MYQQIRDLVQAIQAGGQKQVESLLSVCIANGLDINIRDRFGSTLLICACQSGHAEIVKTLLAHGADANLAAGGLTALHHATMSGSEEMVSDLLGNGANIDAQSTMGDTVLHLAVRFRRFEVEALLINKGARLTIRNSQGIIAADMDPVRSEAWAKRGALVMLRERLKQETDTAAELQ